MTLLEVIGQGSFGVVHRAIWRGVVVAAKVIPLASCSDANLAMKELGALR